MQLYWTLSHLIKPTQSNTKHSVDLPFMKTHPFNAMSPCICHSIMPFQVISCHMHNECYMNNSTHAYHQCIIDNYIYMHIISIHHFIQVNILCKHILTFTFNMSFYDQAMTHKQASHVMAIAHNNSSHVNVLEHNIDIQTCHS